MQQEAHWPQNDTLDEELAVKLEAQEDFAASVAFHALDADRFNLMWTTSDTDHPSPYIVEEREKDNDEKTNKRKRCKDDEDQVLSVKKQETKQPVDQDAAKITFFKDRVDDFKLFLKRRIPPTNPTAQAYLEEFLAFSPGDFAVELLTTVSRLQMVGGLELIFGRMCAKAAMKSEDFVDRSIERPDLKTEKQIRDQLTVEIVDYHTQLKEMIKLAKELPPKFFLKK